jgi:Kef-type K+ transport system membrane component KefB
LVLEPLAMHSLFFELGLVIISAAAVGLVGHFLKQPLILAYIAAGILIGPFGFGLVEDIEIIHTIANVGIMLMLFLVGLEMNPGRLKDLGWVAFSTGVGQVLFTALVGYGLVTLFGFSLIETVYLVTALTFSSTVIAVKLIYDKGDNNSLYGQVAISVLLVQDALAILALLALSGFESGSFTFDYARFGEILLKGSIMAILAIVVARRLLGRLYNVIATSRELLILFSLGWAFGVALVSETIGFSIEIGAFIAGVSLASLPYTYEINAKTKVLRDFFITIFFVGLGAGIVFTSMGPLVIKFLILSIFILMGNPLIVMVIMGLLGYDKRTSFFTGLSVANISEFSLILVTLGQSLGHLDDQVVAMVTVIGMLTMTLSSYMITYNNKLYEWLKGPLTFFEFKKVQTRLSTKKSALQNHIVLVGCGRMGRQVFEQIKTFKENYLVVDHDNSTIKTLMKEGATCIFGDVEDQELLQELDLKHAELVISTLPDPQNNSFLIKHVQALPQKDRPILIVTSDSAREGVDLFNSGADYVILRPYLGADHVYQISRELYHLGEETLALPMAVVDEKKLKNDHDYAKVLHSLNKLRLAEIRQKIGKGGVVLQAKD